MKRFIVILSLVVLALVLWNRFSSRHPTTKETFGETSLNTNAGSQRAVVRRSQLAALPEAGLTHFSSTNEDEGTGWKKLSREQVEAYLVKTKRSPESLLNAFIETGDTNFLNEAVQKYPDNSIVQWTMLNRASPEERAQWVEKLRTSSPDNALPNYLSALDNFKAGKTDQALAEIDSASKKKLSAFEQERAQSREEMYLLAGYSPLEAKTQSMETLILPNLAEMKSLAQEISSLQQKYKAAGDNSSAQQLAAVGIEIGSKVADGKSSPTLIHQLVGYAMENIALKNLDAGTYYDFLGKTAGERFQEIKTQKQEVKDLIPVHTELYPRLSDAEKMIYLDRLKLYGELNAIKWLKRNYGGETK